MYGQDNRYGGQSGFKQRSVDHFDNIKPGKTVETPQEMKDQQF